jgi:hypothetical protein
MLGLLQLLLLVAAIGLFLWRGVRREAKLAVALLFAVSLLEVGQRENPLEALRLAAIVLATTFATMMFGISRWRAVADLAYRPLAEEGWPRHARGELERWTGELSHLGWEPMPDVEFDFQGGGTWRRGCVRFFRHAAEPAWVSISASQEPKAIGRCVSSATAERVQVTSDKMTDYELLHAPHISTTIVPGWPTCARLLEAHRVALPAGAQPSGDPIADALAARRRWVDHIVSRGTVKREGAWLKLPLLGAARTAALTLRNWFR